MAMPPTVNNDIARIVRRYGEAAGATEHQITRALTASGNALHEAAPPTDAVLAGMDSIDRVGELTRETSE